MERIRWKKNWAPVEDTLQSWRFRFINQHFEKILVPVERKIRSWWNKVGSGGKKLNPVEKSWIRWKKIGSGGKGRTNFDLVKKNWTPRKKLDYVKKIGSGGRKLDPVEISSMYEVQEFTDASTQKSCSWWLSCIKQKLSPCARFVLAFLRRDEQPPRSQQHSRRSVVVVFIVSHSFVRVRIYMRSLTSYAPVTGC